jgi:protein-S-isoprenylcysteine O-methyltransferase Ste14
MRAYTFRYLCGLTVLATHALAIFMIASATRFIDVKDQIGSILIVAPVTLIYASRFVKYVVDNTSSQSKDLEQFDLMAAIVMYLVVLIFCGSLLYIVVRFVYLSNYLVNDFKMWLGASETAFGALIALVFEKLFGQAAPINASAANKVAAQKTEPAEVG